MPDSKQANQQLKIWVATDTAFAFKQACTSARESMATVLSRYMAEYAEQPIEKKGIIPDYSTRRKRRAIIKKMVTELYRIRDSEARSRDNTPENLQGSEIWEKADEIISLLEEAIDALESAMVP